MGQPRAIHLLDTHTLLWALTEPDRLGADAITILKNPAAPLAVSAVSAWGIAIKHRQGKLPQANVLINNYSAHISRLKAIRLPITDDHALLAGELEWNHRDPFDRMLAAQCIHEDLCLMTRDPVFADMPGVVTIW